MIINAGNIQTLFTAYSAAYQQAFDNAPSRWKDIAMRIPSSAESETYGWLKALPELREWVGERVVNNIGVMGYRIVNRKFENTVSVERTKIEDDQFGIFAPVMSQMGMDAAMHPDRLVFSLLAAGFITSCWDGQNFFDTEHPVGDGQNLKSVSNVQAGAGPGWYLLDCSKPLRPLVFQDRSPYTFTALNKENDERVFWYDEYVYGVRARCNVGYGMWQTAFGSKAPLNSDNYAAARAAMQSFASDSGKPLGVSPTHLVVPPALERDARRLLVSDITVQTVDNGSGTLVAAAVSNEWAGSAEMLMTPYLTPGA